MAAAIPVPLTGRIDVNDIKRAFPSTNANNMRAYFGKDWYKPSDGSTGTFTTTGPLRDSDFRGKIEIPIIRISSDSYNVDILPLVQSRIPYAAGSTAVLIYVDPGVKIGSRGAGQPSMIVRGFRTGDNIIIVNNGDIRGAGGGGGQQGGDALQVAFPITFTNNGILAGGGGGGGKGPDGRTYGGIIGCSSLPVSGDPGGGGAGNVPGGGGATDTYGGASSGNGAPGGNIGQPGSTNGGGGAGAAGYYLNGSTFIKNPPVGGTKIGRLN